ncbi:ABC transporter permease, partial [Roseicyclus sp.]|uniref:ABC transporter permease n=1 Tax=Roseicyclus sp. TaxID=1914329 RepID=UPI003F6CF2E8
MSFAASVILGLATLFAIAWALRAGARATFSGQARSLAHDIPLTAAFGLLVIAIYTFVAIAAPALAPFPERDIVGGQFQAWSAEHWLGTDRIGRDMLSRLIYGARNTVGIAFATTALAFVVGAILGLWAALVGGWLDQALSRFVDALMAIPALIFSLLLLTIFGTSVLTLILVIAAVDATRVFRLARAVAQGIVVMDYIEAAKLRGEGSC